ncbi:MAG: HupE/UreJ family protein [Verrucomicrobiota bacterium]
MRNGWFSREKFGSIMGNAISKREQFLSPPQGAGARPFLCPVDLVSLPRLMNKSFRKRSGLALLLAVLGGATHLLAHEVGLSSATWQWQTNQLEGTLTFAVRETEELVPLDRDRDGRVSPDEFSLGRDALAATIATNCQISLDGVPVEPGDIRCQLDSSNNVDVVLSFPKLQGKELELDFLVIRLLTPGHRMFFSLRDPTGQTIAERLLNQNSTRVLVQFDTDTPAAPATSPAPPPSFAGFLKLGVEHILTGYDHLLFLFALLIVTRNFMSALQVITCFTVAHSITLGVATFDLLHVSSRIVEPLIAVTIIYVGLENVWKHGDPHGRWMLTFAFGLIHGFGFASVLRELGIGARAGGVAMPLLAFNLGVELGQIAVAAIALPLIWQLRKKELFLRYGVPACSILVALAGAYWLVQRL